MVKECLLRLLIKYCLKNILRYRKKICALVDNKLYNIMYYEGNKKYVRYINSRISIINGEIKTDFYDNFNKKDQKVAYDCFSLIDLNSINESINENNNYVRYPQVYLEDVNIK